MRKLSRQTLKLCLEYPDHILGFTHVPSISAAGLRHRQKQIFVKVTPDADRGRRDSLTGKLARLRDDAIDIRLSDIGETVGDEQYAIDRRGVERFANLHSCLHPAFVERRRASVLDPVDAAMEHVAIRYPLIGEENI